MYLHGHTQHHFEDVANTTEYQLATKLVDSVQALHPYFAERPRFASLYDQLTRSTQSVLLNFAEAIGKGRGFYTNSLYVSRAEAYEASATLDICPKDVRTHLYPLAVELTRLLTARIKAAPTKSTRCD